MAKGQDEAGKFAPVSNLVIGLVTAAGSILLGAGLGWGIATALGQKSRLSVEEAVMMGAEKGWYVSLGLIATFVLLIVFRGKGKANTFFQILGGAMVWIPTAIAFGWNL